MDKDSLLSIAGIILGILVSLFFYILDKKHKKLSIHILTTNLVSLENLNLKKLKIQYDNKNIKTLNNTKIIIKNIGNDIIESQDFASLAPLIICTDGMFFMSNSTEFNIKTSNSVNKVNLEAINNINLKITFEFLNPSERIYVNILHTDKITVQGKLKNGEIQIENKEYERKSKNKKRRADIIIEMLFWIAGIAFIIGVYIFMPAYFN